MTRTNNTKQLVRSRDGCPLMGMAGENGKRVTAGWGMLVATLALGFSLATISVAEVRGEEASHWKAGWARADITPKRFMWMAGYGGRTAPADGQLTPLWAKALALENAAGQRAVLISLDLVGIDHETTAFICGALEQECGLTRAQIAIATSHTHTGPAVGKNLGPLHYWLVDDAQRKLVYRGQMDDSRPDSGIPVTGKDLTAAIDAAIAGKPPLEEQKPSLGCNIKWQEAPEYFDPAGVK